MRRARQAVSAVGLLLLLVAALTLFSSPTPAKAQDSAITVAIAAGEGIAAVNGENRAEGDSFNVTITFSEDIGTTFTHSDITASNADTITAADLTTDTAGLVFTLTVRPTAGFSGDLTLQVGSGMATDASSKANAQSNLFTAAVTVKSACITGGAVPAAAPDLAGDCAVLLDLHDQLTGSATLSPAWSVTTAIGSWQGITIRDSRVGDLELARSSLDGTLPAQLGQLSGLTELYLNSNQLTGTIPAELGNLSKLRELTLHENMLTGAIPAELGSLPLLERMTLSTNRLTGTIPGELGSLSSLWGLWLTDNQLTGAIPGELGSLPALRDLKLSNNQLTGSIPPELGSLPALEELILYSNQLTGSIPPELGSLSALEVLELSRNRLSGAIPAEIGSLSNVTQLYLYTNQLTGPLPAALGNMAALEHFHANNNEITGSIPAELGRLTNLEDLQLYENNLSGNIPAALGDLSKLESLWLHDNQLEGIPASLSKLQSLEGLLLYENRLTGSIPDLSNMAELTFLSLGKNQLTGSIPALGNMPKLHTLHLHCNQLSGNIPAALGSLTALKNISLRDNDLTGEIPDLTALTNLNSLSVHYNYLEGDFTDVASLLAKLPTVSYLRIRLNANRFDGVDPITGALSEPPSWLDPQSRGSCAPRVSFILDEHSVAEGDTVEVTVVLSADPGQSVVIPLAADKLGAAEDADFTLPESITFDEFESGESTKTGTITFTAVQDMTDDDDEGVSVRFGTLPEGIRPVARVKTTVSIIDDDDPQVQVSYGLAEYTAAEGGSVTVTVKLDADPERTVVIPVTHTARAGATGADYFGVPANVTFDAEDTSKTFTFSATDDTVDDDDEEVLLGFGTLPTGVSAGTVKETLVSITDDDLPASLTVNFGEDRYTVAEGGTVEVTVTLDEDPETTVVIPLARENLGGTSDSDYSGVPESVTFGSGDTSRTFTVAAVDDKLRDSGEELKLTFGTLPSGVSEGSLKEARVTITDSQVQGELTVGFGLGAITVAEGATAQVTVSLSEAPGSDVTIPLTATGQDGATSSDYSGVPESVTFESSDTEQTFTFTAVDDTVDDDGESVLLAFGTLPSGVLAGTVKETLVSITDGDLPASLTVNFGEDRYTVAEGGTVEVTVTLDDDPERTVVIPVTAAGQDGATSSDYSEVPANVTFHSGDTEKSFTFTATHDTVDDDDESVKLTFRTLPTGVSAGTVKETLVSITDDDDPQVEVNFRRAIHDVAEGADRTVTVNLTADPERTVVIPLTATDQDGASSADYSVPDSVTFDSGETTKDVTFTATQDAIDDDGEKVLLEFGTLPDGVTPGTVPTSTVSIIDDDAPASVAVSWAQDTYTVAEGGSVTVTAELDDDPEKTVVVPIARTDQGGADSGDYSGVPSTITFESGDTSKTFTFTATDDAQDDDDESVQLAFGPTLPSGVTQGTPSTTTVSITDDDLAGDRLASLVVAPRDIDGFDPEVIDYMVGVASTVTRATITATPGQTDSTVAIDGTAVTAGSAHAVDLSAGLNTFEVVVTSADNDQATYTVYIGRGTTDQGGWKAGDDLDTLRATGNTEPSGIWSNGATVWIADVSSAKLYAYSQAGGARDVDKDIALGGVIMAPMGIWSDGATIWVIGPVEMTAFAYTLGSGARDSDSDISLGSDLMLPVDMWSDGVTMWVLDSHDDKLYAYTLSGGARDTSKDIDLAGENAAPLGIWSNGTTVWVTDIDDRKLYAYNFSGERVTGHDIDLHSRNANAGAIWGNGDTLWVANDVNDVSSPFNRVFTYNNVPVTVTFGQSSYTVAESDDTSTTEVAENAVEVKVTLSADPKRQVVVPITATRQGTVTGADYSGVPANLTFESGETEKSFTFTAIHDTLDDDDESVRLTFGMLPPGVTGGTNSEAVVTITDDDIGVSFERMGYETIEGGSVDVKVTLSSPATREVTIQLDTDKQGGASDDDYSGVEDSITFRFSDTETSIRFTAVDDELDDDGEQVRLRFGALPTGLVPGPHVEATITITDNDLPTDRLMSLVVAPKDIDGFDPEVTDYMVGVASTVTQATITATPHRPDDTVTIDGTTVTGGSAHTVDLSVGLNAFAVVVDSAITQVQSTYTVYIGRGTAVQGGWKAGDDMDTLRSPGNTSPTGAWSNGATMWIADQNDGKLYAYTLADGSRDSDKDITLDSNNSSPVGVWSNDTTIWVAELMPTERKVYAYTLADGSRDSDKDITLRGGNTTSWGLWSDGTTMWVVDWNDDEVYAYTLADDARDSDKDITLHGDNTSPRGTWSDGTTIWVVDSTGVKLYAYALSDGVRVEGYDIGLHSSNAGAGGIWANDDTAWVVNSATEDGSPFDRVFTYNNIPVEVSFQIATYTVAEGANVTITVTLNVDPERRVTIPITAANEGGATAADYSVPDSVTFDSGQTTRDITFTAEMDDVDDDGESVLLGFGTTLSAGVTAGTTSETVVSITDDDVPDDVKVSFGSSTYTVAEGASVTVTVAMEDPEQTVTIPIITTNEDGATNADYSSVPNSVTFESGDTSKTFTFTATDDTIDDDGERVKFTFGALPTGVTAGTNIETIVSITDDDVPDDVKVSFGSSTYTVAEGASVTVTVAMEDPEQTVTIPIITTNEGGATNADYSSVPQTVTFDSGDTSKTFTFTATQDSDDDDGERVKLTFGTLPTGVTAGTTSETVVSITDDDVPDDVKVSFGSSTYTVAEGASVTVTVAMEDPEQTVTIPIITTNEDGATNADYSSVPLTVTFDSGDTSKTITFTATQDSDDDDGEQVKLTFGALPTGVTAGTNSETIVSITDDDLPATVTVRFVRSTYSATEGGDDAVVTVILGSPTKSQVEIPLTAKGHGGATEDDWSGVPETVIFDTGDDSKSFTVTAFDDNVEDDGEMVELGFGTLPAGFAPGSPSTARITLMNDDGIETPGQNLVCTKGEITVGGQTDRWIWRITDSDYRDEYTIDLMGLHSNNGTLRDPHIVYITKIYTHDGFYPPAGSVYGTFPSYGSNDGGVGWDSSSQFRFRNRTGSYSYFPGKEPELDTGYYTALVGANPFGDGANGLGSYTLCIEGPGSISAVDQPERRIVVSAAHVDVSDDEPAQFSIKLGARPTGPVEVFMTKLEPASDSQYVVEPLLHSFTVDNWDIPQVATVRRKADYVTPKDDGFPIHYWGKGGGYHKAFEFIEVYDRVPRWMTLRSTYDPEPDLTDQVAEAQKQNSPATGGPGIQGVARAGETLTATTSGIRDDDGLDNAVFAYQWVRSELGAESGTAIAGATGSSYGVTAEDEGRAITVRVTFTDDAGNEESVISYAVVASAALPQTRAPDPPGAPDVSPHDSTSLAVSWTAPGSDGGSTITGYKVQWKEATDSWDTPADVSEEEAAGTSRTITGLTGGTAYSVRVLAINDIGEGLPSDDGSGTPRETVPPELSGASVDGAALTLTFNEALDEDSEPATTAFTVTVNDNVRAVDSVDVTGGAVTLTLASAVTSQDTVTVSYTVPASASAERLRDAVGNAAASFTDESVTNDTGPAALPQTRVPDPPGAPDVAAQDSTSLAVTWTEPASDGGSAITGYRVQWKEAADSWDTPADVSEAAAAGTSHTITGLTDGTGYSVRIIAVNSVGDGAPSPEATGTPTAGDSDKGTKGAQGNRPAEGLPAITGEPTVGETLRADTSGISDKDGIKKAVFTYQWMAGEGDIDGANGASYTLTDDEEGLAVQVLVSFTDDEGNPEAVTSVGTAAVSPANTPASGVPAITGILRDGETLTADTSGISDEEMMDNAVFTYRWVADGLDIDGATGSTYTLTVDEVGTAISVWVSFTDDAGNPEAVTSALTEAVAPKPPLTAQFLDTPGSHDGQNAMIFELRLSESPRQGFSYTTLRDHAFTVTGGEVVRARRLEPGKNVRWEIHVSPDSNVVVTIVLPATTDCEAEGAICTGDGRMLSELVELTVSGPGG